MSGELIVPTPQIAPGFVDSVTGFLSDRAALVNFTLAPVHKGDGSELGILEAKSFGYYIYRREPSGDVTIWNKNASPKGWYPPADVPEGDREPGPLEYVGGDNTWKGLVIFMGGKDKFPETDTAGTYYYRYFIRCRFERELSDGTIHNGESANSVSVLLPKLGGDLKSGLDFAPDVKNPETAEFFIKSGGGTAAYVRLNKNGSITIMNALSNASITIGSGGGVVIDGTVNITGNVYANDYFRNV